MGRKMRMIVFLCVMVLLATIPALAASNPDEPFDWTPEEQAWVRDHTAMYIWESCREGLAAPDYDLTELADLSHRIGARTVRVFLGGFGHDVIRDPNVPAPQRTIIENLESPAYRKVLKEFDTVIFTLGLTDRVWEPEWTRMRCKELTEYLLRTYPRGKTFIIGNWEGDHWCPGQHTWDEAIAMWQARHEGIVAGRATVPKATSKVLEMIEMVSLDYEGKERMINRLAPLMHADLYALSSWGYVYELPKALSYMKSKCPDSPGFGNDNVMIGEMGLAQSVRTAERTDFFRRRMRELKAANAPYVTIWQLADGDSGLRGAKYHGGRKTQAYYLFSRALHSQDDPYIIDDFEIDPFGPPEGDTDEDGLPVNAVGGHRKTLGSATAAMLSQPSSRALHLSFSGRADAGWEEQLLGQLNADRYRFISFRAKGDLENLMLRLTDASGAQASVSLPAGNTHRWRTIRIPRKSFAGVDWSRLSSVSIVTAQHGQARQVLLDDIAFHIHSRSRFPAHKGSVRFQANQIKVAASDMPVTSVPHKVKLTSVGISTTATGALTAPAITDGTHTLKLADTLPPRHWLSLSAGGQGEVRIGPLGPAPHLQTCREMGMTIYNLQQNDTYRSLHTLVPNEQCYAEWRFSSPYPVTDFRFVIYGRDNRKAGGEMGISFSTDGTTWQECQIRRGDATYPPLLDGIIGTPPAGYTPSKHIRVRYWMRSAGSDDNWYWNVSIADLTAQLTLDTRGALFPSGSGLRYQDGNVMSSPGTRGLLSLDW